jgi:DNA-directed RNA polymerase subunit RPC12/RpoP
MDDKPKRPILSLKLGPKPPAAPVAAAPAATTEWKCKPCGKAFQVPPELADSDYVRCPACNARLGLAADFRGETPNLAKIRARAVVKTEPEPTPTKPAVQVVSVTRRGRR